METIIRPAEERDVPVLAGFEREISVISFGQEAIVDEEFHAEKIRKALKKNNAGMLVMETSENDYESKLIGWLWMDERTNSLTHETYVNFRSLYIAEAWRGRPESARLMARGMAYCEGIGASNVVGKVHILNPGMRAMYKNFGFQATHLTMEYRFPC